MKQIVPIEEDYQYVSSPNPTASMSAHPTPLKSEEPSSHASLRPFQVSGPPSPSSTTSPQEPITPKKLKMSIYKNRKLKYAQIFKYQRSGHWTIEENFHYRTFLLMHPQNFERRNERKSEKIFKKMSKHLQTRTADQCRSHHQKMERRCPSFEDIITFLDSVLLKAGYQQQQPTFVENIHAPLVCPEIPSFPKIKAEQCKNNPSQMSCSLFRPAGMEVGGPNFYSPLCGDPGILSMYFNNMNMMYCRLNQIYYPLL